MKKIIYTMILSLAALSFSGCALTFQEPSSLIMPPASTHEEYLERTLINSYLADNERLEVPENMDSPAAFITLDGNKDGEDEKLVFWSSSDRREVGALLLAKNSQHEWVVADQIRQYGNNINYFKLVDLGNDGNLEACFGVDIGGYNVLYVYSLSEGRLSEVERVNYSLIDVVDLDGKGNYGVLTALNDANTTTLTSGLYLYKYNDNFECVYKKSFDGACVALEYGKVSEDKTGVYYVRTADYSKVNADLLLKKASGGFEEQMTSSFTYLNTASGFGGIVKDINGDGILELHTVVEPVEVKKRSASEFLQVWQKWNGDVGMSNVYGIIDNTTDGYQLILPAEWLDDVRYQYVTEKNCNQIRIYDGKNTEPAVVFGSILEDEESGSKMPADSVNLGMSPSGHNSYYAQINAQTFAGRALNEKVVKNAFRIEGGEIDE